MSQLVAYFDGDRVPLKGRVEIEQLPMSAASAAQSIEGAIRPSLVYVRAPSAAGAVLVPFGAYDEWSLRDRYNEVLRIMSELGASSITCESFREVTRRRGLAARIKGHAGSLQQQRVENSGFDYRHNGRGRPPRDPRPLRWPDEPGLAAAVTNVLENGVTDIVINIKSNRTHSINGSLGLQLKGVGFELGGHSESSGATSLHIRAIFPSPSSPKR